MLNAMIVININRIRHRRLPLQDRDATAETIITMYDSFKCFQVHKSLYQQ